MTSAVNSIGLPTFTIPKHNFNRNQVRIISYIKKGKVLRINKTVKRKYHSQFFSGIEFFDLEESLQQESNFAIDKVKQRDGWKRIYNESLQSYNIQSMPKSDTLNLQFHPQNTRERYLPALLARRILNLTAYKISCPPTLTIFVDNECIKPLPVISDIYIPGGTAVEKKIVSVLSRIPCFSIPLYCSTLFVLLFEFPYLAPKLNGLDIPFNLLSKEFTFLTTWIGLDGVASVGWAIGGIPIYHLKIWKYRNSTKDLEWIISKSSKNVDVTQNNLCDEAIYQDKLILYNLNLLINEFGDTISTIIFELGDHFSDICNVIADSKDIHANCFTSLRQVYNYFSDLLLFLNEKNYSLSEIVSWDSFGNQLDDSTRDDSNYDHDVIESIDAVEEADGFFRDPYASQNERKSNLWMSLANTFLDNPNKSGCIFHRHLNKRQILPIASKTSNRDMQEQFAIRQMIFKKSSP